MHDTTHLYLAKLTAVCLIAMLVWSCRNWPKDKPQHVGQLRIRHVLPMAGVFVPCVGLGVLFLAVLGG